MATYCTYDMKGIKSEFADWVSNISPEYTPFISMLRKFPVHNTIFHWQTDSLAVPNPLNAVEEGSDAKLTPSLTSTTVHSNYTQIMRKVVMVSDTANAVATYGKEKELFYQLKKAAKELKRDNEAIFLQYGRFGRAGSTSDSSLTASLGAQIDVGNRKRISLDNFEEQLFAATEQLYTLGSEANIIMFHPNHAFFFSHLQEATDSRVKIFQNDKRFEMEVNFLIDPLGQEYKLIPNRWMPEDSFYIFNPEDISMAVLRAPQQIKLEKKGSAEKYMIEQEVGLRLHNPLAAVMCTFEY